MFWISVKSQLKIKAETLASMAKATELNYRTIQNQISRGISPDVDTAIKIAQYLNTTVEYLATGIQPELSKQDVLYYLQNHLS